MRTADGREWHLDEDSITSIVTGLLPREETLRALDHLSYCGPCEALFLSSVKGFEAARVSAVPVQLEDGRWVLPSNADVSPDSSPGERSSGKWFGWLTPFRVAAAVVLVALAAPLFFDTDPSNPEYWMPDDGRAREIRSTTEVDALLWQGIEAYNDRDARAAIDLLERAQVSGVYEMLRDVYLVSALQLSGRNSEATELSLVLERAGPPQPWRNRIRWVRYLALVSAGRTADADELLEMLSQNEGEIGDLAREQKSR